MQTHLALLLGLAALLVSCKGDEPDVKTIYFPDSDQVKQRIEYKNGRKNGVFEEFYRSGRLKARQHYVNDSLNDTTVIYHPNGHLKSLHVYRNKIRSGTWRDYNKEGKLYSEMSFENGLLNGPCCRYTYRTARLQYKSVYLKGQLHGIEETYHPNGQLKSRGRFELGLPVGEVEEWEDNGQKINTDFDIHVQEKDESLLANRLRYIVRLENPRPDDEVVQLMRVDNLQSGVPLKKEGDTFVLDIDVNKGNFVMEKITFAAFRKTRFGHTVIRKTTVNASTNNF